MNSRRSALSRTAAGAAALALLLLGAVPAASAAEPADHAGSSEQPDAARQSVIRGGDSVYSAGRVCTVAFNATDGAEDYAITSGQCVSGGTNWYADASMTVPVGATVGTSFPVNDFGVIRYTNPAVSHPGEVGTGSGDAVDITGSASPVVGSSMCHIGRVSGMSCGTVTAVNVSVNYPDGTVSGLFSSSARSEPGDAGGPAFTSGGKALGFIVGASAGSTFYQPIGEVLATWGLTLS